MKYFSEKLQPTVSDLLNPSIFSWHMHELSDASQDPFVSFCNDDLSPTSNKDVER